MNKDHDPKIMTTPPKMICEVCGGGPGNDGVCLCGMKAYSEAILRGTEVRELRSDIERMRKKIMDLIAAELLVWDDTDPPRHALSVLWGKVRDLEM